MSVLDLSDARAHLNITGAAQDAEILTVVDAAEAVVAARIGPLQSSVSRTARVAGGGTVLLLPSVPVASVATVTPTDTTPALDTTLLVLNTSSGTLEYAAGGRFTSSTYTVVYTAGYATVPDDILFAIKELARHLWTTQRGGSTRPGAGAGDVAAPGYLIPNRVAELLEPYRVPGIA